MNATQAKRALEAAAKKAGGLLEEDNARPPMRCFQLVTPHGRVWSGNGSKHVRVDIDSQRAKHATEWNAAEVALALEIIADGHRTMTEAEAYDCDEIPA
jgi:hypothetical protein